jgi:hypothetical protein
MSHGKERKEKNCLNCNARVFGRYCHVCGQENIEPKETAWELVVHFFNDITHFEGKFIASLRYLLFKPGFLTAEYLRGRRASYMNPVRMYVFASAFFFILFFSFFAGENDREVIKITNSKGGIKLNTSKNLQMTREQALINVDTKEDSAIIDRLLPAKDSASTASAGSRSLFSGIGGKYKTVAEYDSVQRSLPKEKRDEWFARSIQRRSIVINEKYGGDFSAFNKALFEHALHALPKMLFISLPLFALILSLLYIRRKQFYYVSHVIFTIHLFVFVFLVLLLIFTSGSIMSKTGWPLGWVPVVLWGYMFFYLYKAMRRVYAQGRLKTISKYILLLMLALVLNIFLFLGLFSYSFFNF